MFCSNCGTRISEEDKFCKQCGNRIIANTYSAQKQEKVMEKINTERNISNNPEERQPVINSNASRRMPQYVIQQPAPNLPVRKRNEVWPKVLIIAAAVLLIVSGVAFGVIKFVYPKIVKTYIELAKGHSPESVPDKTTDIQEQDVKTTDDEERKDKETEDKSEPISGNTLGNILNRAWVVEKDGWIYYSAIDNSGDFAFSKMKTDGGPATKLCSGYANYINIVDDVIYFTMYLDEGFVICSIKTDGTEMKTIYKLDRVGSTSDITVAGEWIYFVANIYYEESEGIKSTELYKIKTDGAGAQMLHTGMAKFPAVVDDWIYFVNCDDEYKLYKVKTDGTGIVKCADVKHVNYPIIQGDYVYYLNDSGDAFSGKRRLYRMKIDGSDNNEFTDDNVNCINESGNWIYYSQAYDENLICSLVKIKKDGTGRTILVDKEIYYDFTEFGDIPPDICIYDDWIYYSNRGDEDGNLRGYFKVKTDGTGKELIGQ